MKNTRSRKPSQRTRRISRFFSLTGLLGLLGLSVSPVYADTAADTSSKSQARVGFETTVGSFVVEIDLEQAPVTSANFLAYVDADFYDGLVFHRVIPGFVVQGGGYTTQGAQPPTNSPIVYEGDNGLDNDRGTIAMARTQDPDSASSQFYVNLVDNDSLNHSAMKPGYTVFGRVIVGMDTIDRIADLTRSDSGWNAASGAPSRPVEIVSAKRTD